MMLRRPRSQFWHSVCWIPVILCKYYLNTCDPEWDESPRSAGTEMVKLRSSLFTLYWLGHLLGPTITTQPGVSLLCPRHHIILKLSRDKANNSPCYYTSDQSVELSVKGNTLLSTERGAQRQGEARESATRWLVFLETLDCSQLFKWLS